MATLKNLKEHPSKWIPAGTPLLSMMGIEMRKGKPEPVIEKTLVEMNSNMFKIYEKWREIWAMNDCFSSPGPI